MKTKEEIEQLAKEEIERYRISTSSIDKPKEIQRFNGFIKGYTQCQEDIRKEIQSLIDMYNSDIIKLEKEFKDNSSILTLRETSTLQHIVTNLESKLNKED